MTEFVVRLDNRPGSFARLTELLAEAGVNIETLCAWAADGEGIVRFIADDAAAARRALAEAGILADERTVLTTVLPHRPGALAEVARNLADAEVIIEALYVLRSSGDGVEVAIAVDQPEAVEGRVLVHRAATLN